MSRGPAIIVLCAGKSFIRTEEKERKQGGERRKGERRRRRGETGSENKWKEWRERKRKEKNKTRDIERKETTYILHTNPVPFIHGSQGFQLTLFHTDTNTYSIYSTHSIYRIYSVLYLATSRPTCSILNPVISHPPLSTDVCIQITLVVLSVMEKEQHSVTRPG